MEIGKAFVLDDKKRNECRCGLGVSMSEIRRGWAYKVRSLRELGFMSPPLNQAQAQLHLQMQLIVGRNPTKTKQVSAPWELGIPSGLTS